MLRDDHYPSFNVVKWQSSDLIGSLKSRLDITKMNIAVSHQTLPSARREKRRGMRLTFDRDRERGRATSIFFFFFRSDSLNS